MTGLPAITADSLGNRYGVMLPPLPGPGQPPADRATGLLFRELARRDPPGRSVEDRHQQARSFTLAVYVAVRAVMDAMAGASVVVSVRRPQAELPARKSLTASVTAADESEWTPAPPDHPLARLFAHVNPTQTVSDYLAERTLCRCLFGTAVDYLCFAEGDAERPVEMWNLRRNYLEELPVSPQYPRGGWRYAMPRPMLWGAVGQVMIPREHTLPHKYPHPLFPWEGYSPLAAGAKYVDFLNSLIDSRQMAMDHGFTPDVVLKMQGATKEQMTAVKEQLRANHTGQNRGQRILAVDSERIDVELLNVAPDKMAYPQGYDQGTAAVLATFGVLPSVAGLTEQSNYSAFYAAVRQFRELRVNGEAKGTGEFWTKHLARPFYGDDVKVEVKLPPLMDPDLKERQIGTMLSANAITVNEVRAANDMPPLDGGDVTPAEYQARLQQAQQEQQLALQQQTQPAAVPGYGDPAAEPAPPDDDAERSRPEVGAAAAGSRPGAVRKAADRRAYFDRLLAEVCN